MNIKPRLLKGFRDFRGDELRIRKRIFSIFSEIFESYGYEPLETPALEYFDILMGKYGEEEKLVYQFKDNGDRQVAMKYDLTVPTSRVMAQYQNEIKLPWKRYQIQPVWRADNTQKGRFREFYQLDADIFGVKSTIAEAEYIQMGIKIIKKLGFEKFEIRINNRKILNAIAKYAGREDKTFDIIYAIDKWDKRTKEETRLDLEKRLASPEFDEALIKRQIDRIFDCIIESNDYTKTFNSLSAKFTDIPEGLEGIEELKQIFNLVDDKEHLVYDPTIARGLAYYTGPVWEFKIIDGGVGSIGGCGRYDKLVGQYLGRDIPATGGSFGIERIIEVMKDRNMLRNLLETEKKVIIVTLDEKLLKNSFEVAEKIRETGIKVFYYPLVQKLTKAIEYSVANKYANMIIIGEDEVKTQLYTIKDMSTRAQQILTIDKIIELLKNES